MFLIQSNRSCVSGSHLKGRRLRAPRTHFGKPRAKQCKPKAFSSLFRDYRNAHQFRLIAENAHIDEARQCLPVFQNEDAVIRGYEKFREQPKRPRIRKTTALCFRHCLQIRWERAPQNGRCAQRSALAFFGLTPAASSRSKSYCIASSRSRSAWLFLRYSGAKSSAGTVFPAAA